GTGPPDPRPEGPIFPLLSQAGLPPLRPRRPRLAFYPRGGGPQGYPCGRAAHGLDGPPLLPSGGARRDGRNQNERSPPCPRRRPGRPCPSTGPWAATPSLGAFPPAPAPSMSTTRGPTK